MKEILSLSKYEGLSIYEYKELRRNEKGTKTRSAVNSNVVKARDEVWNYLLKDDSLVDLPVFQKYHFWAYNPKPNPKHLIENEAQILILESQRRFLQMVDHSITDDQEVMHLDLSSAYLTALSNIKHSLKFNTKYPLHIVNELSRNGEDLPIHWYIEEDKFNIIKVRLKMPYDNKINIFTPNNKIKYKGKEVSDVNLPIYGDEVEVRLELFVNNKYNIDSWDSWTTIFKGYDIEYIKVDVFTYDLINRKELFDLSDVKQLLDSLTEVPKYNRGFYKQAIVSFTGQLMNIDPGRRLLMLASAEEVMRRLYITLSRRTTVYGLQIDGIYYEPYDYPSYEEPMKVAFDIGREVYRIPGNIGYQKEDFSKVELWNSSKYSIKPFRIQEVR